jgi:hypothetical protein
MSPSSLLPPSMTDGYWELETLGGVGTLTSLETLWAWGYQFDAIVFVEGGYGR